MIKYITSFQNQLNFVYNINIKWIPIYYPNNYWHYFNVTYWELTNKNDNLIKYRIKDLHPGIYYPLILRYFKYAKIFKRSLAIIKVIKKYPSSIMHMKGVSYEIQGLAFRLGDYDLKICMINNSKCYNMEEYINSLEFEKEFGYLKLVNSIGIFDG